MPIFKRRKNTRTPMKLEPGFAALCGAGYLEVLSALETQVKPDWYLEIGSRKGPSLKDRRCKFIAIDPKFKLGANVFNTSTAQLFFQMESDAFFEDGFLARSAIVPDLAFIDGLHLIDYVLRDFRNVEASMAKGGVIALHDVLPFNSEMTTRDVGVLETINAWTGDVWKIIPIFQRWRPDLVLEVVGAPRTGILVVRNIDPANRVLFDEEVTIFNEFLDLELGTFGPPNFSGAFTLLDPQAYIDGLA